MEKYRSTKRTDIDERIVIFQRCVDCLLSLPLEKKYYSSDQQKAAVAQAIVRYFPCLKSEDALSYFCIFFNSRFIDKCLKTIRLKLPQETGRGSRVKNVMLDQVKD